MNRSEEVQFKLTRVRGMMHDAGIAAALLKTQANFAWLTAGGLNSVGVATEMGVTSILVTPDRHYLIANATEASRTMQEEGLADLGFELLSFDWFENRELELAREAAGADASTSPAAAIGCDFPIAAPGFIDISSTIASLRRELTPPEIERYTLLGARTSAAIDKVAASARPGDSEAEIVGRLLAELWKHRIDATGYIAATDDRIELYRHAIPTMNRIEKRFLLSVNARHHGLIVSATRMVHFGTPSPALVTRYRDNLRIEAAMIAATRVGRTLSDIFAEAVKLYEELGYADEWRRLHIGGSTGYAARETKATPSTRESVHTHQAFCWNPTLTGTKAEDTFAVLPEGPRMITGPATFPSVELEAGGICLALPDMLVV
ncbi:MAG: Metallopeptidase family M24 [Firmicutes bacterium ADurb.Bin506]|nr:MAG: Metallopeptidase family M24 [Firmicutes bacterium ADurb.Bin506]